MTIVYRPKPRKKPPAKRPQAITGTRVVKHDKYRKEPKDDRPIDPEVEAFFARMIRPQS